MFYVIFHVCQVFSQLHTHTTASANPHRRPHTSCFFAILIKVEGCPSQIDAELGLHMILRKECAWATISGDIYMYLSCQRKCVCYNDYWATYTCVYTLKEHVNDGNVVGPLIHITSSMCPHVFVLTRWNAHVHVVGACKQRVHAWGPVPPCAMWHNTAHTNTTRMRFDKHTHTHTPIKN